ncbi:FMN-dependent NADH-azoreductase [Rhodovulum sp. DZ06]|uniref:FMN-dependent NADH-azoreductase n=1 Tax=Rhodovulum sp. DZ06 TaxID=3425126 RepID=UPI003D34D0F4
MTVQTTENLLLVTGSIRGEDSASTRLATRLAERLAPGGYAHRDAASGLEMVDGEWLGAMATAPEARDARQAARAELAETLMDEVKAADTLVIAVPIYNFSPAAQIKTWFDQLARAGVAFKYSEAGPEGLLTGRKAWIVMTSNGTEEGSAIDFATPWVKHMLGFFGIEVAGVIAADRQAFDESSVDKALEQVEALPLAA